MSIFLTTMRKQEERKMEKNVGKLPAAAAKKTVTACIVNPNLSKSPPIKKRKKTKSKKPARKKGCIITTVSSDSLEVFLDAQERVLRRLAATHNIHVVQVHRLVGDLLSKEDLVKKIKELVEINEYEVILAQSRYRLGSNICDVLDFEIFVIEHGAEMLYL